MTDCKDELRGQNDNGRTHFGITHIKIIIILSQKIRFLFSLKPATMTVRVKNLYCEYIFYTRKIKFNSIL